MNGIGLEHRREKDVGTEEQEIETYASDFVTLLDISIANIDSGRKVNFLPYYGHEDSKLD